MIELSTSSSESARPRFTLRETSVVEGIELFFFDVGNDERKMEEALEHCHKHLGDKATILYDDCSLPSSMMKMVINQGKEAGGPWECFRAHNIFGWEADRVVAVTVGDNIMELITRARTHLYVIMVDRRDRIYYAETKKYFQQAAKLGLIDMV